MLKIRNIAIIAHVDHGKTTLVDRMIFHSKLLDNVDKTGSATLDSNDLERERGITILAKNVSVPYLDYKINIIDTPGHADFGGEVERVLNMVDGVLLLVDAFEGTMPQTRFVLEKGLEMGKKVVVVINKIDKPNCRPNEVNEEVFELMLSLNASDQQLDFKTIYGSAKFGRFSFDPNIEGSDISPILDTIVEEIPPPKKLEGAAQMLISSLEYSPYVGRIAIGRVHRGQLETGMEIALCRGDGKIERGKIKELMLFEGLEKRKVSAVSNGDICAVVGVEGFDIGDTIADYHNPEPLATIVVDQPTMSMLFTINDSPFYGREGKYVTSRQIRERLNLEVEKNLALKVKEGLSADSFIVQGRGVLHLSILIETMRREGFELQVGQPKVLDKNINGIRCEPIEYLVVDLPEEMVGRAIEMITKRKGMLLHIAHKSDRSHLEFDIPSRGLIGLRSNLITATQGEAVISHRFKGYEPYKGEIEKRFNGSLVAIESGTAIAYAMDKLQDRGHFFIEPGEEIYEGQIVGESSRAEDMGINLCKTKKLTNIRAAGSDDKVTLPPPIIFSLEESLEYINDDELVEITPKSIRLRKIYLSQVERQRRKG
ncbi:MAG: translational GTPase TypA [Bacteroidales bacterium]